MSGADASVRDGPKKKKKKTARKKLYELHTWVGFHLAVIMFVVLFTGTVATIANEIDWITQHDMRVSPDGEKVSWGEMTEAVQFAHPDATITRIQSMMGDHFAYRADVTDPYGVRAFVHVNQWTGEVTGTTHPLTVQRVFRDLHRYLFMPGLIGLPIVCSMAIFLSISLYTGLKTSRNWRTLMTRVRVSKGPRTAVGDAHKAAGLWSIWFFVLIIVTSFWYFAEWGTQIGGGKFIPDRPTIPIERAQSFGDVIPIHETDTIIAAAQEAMPELEIADVFFPVTARSIPYVNGSRGNPILRNRANQVFLDPITLEPIKIQYSEEVGWVAWLNETADPLHFGFFGGLPTKLIWFVFGVAMTGLSASGVWLTYKRLRTVSISRAQIASFPILLTATFFGYHYLERYNYPEPPAAEQVLVTAIEGQFQLTPRFALSSENTLTGDMQLRVFSEQGRINLKEIVLQLYRDGAQLGAEVSARPGFAVASTPINTYLDPAYLVEANQLSAEVIFGSGRILQLRWDLPENSTFASVGMPN